MTFSLQHLSMVQLPSLQHLAASRCNTLPAVAVPVSRGMAARNGSKSNAILYLQYLQYLPIARAERNSTARTPYLRNPQEFRNCVVGFAGVAAA